MLLWCLAVVAVAGLGAVRAAADAQVAAPAAAARSEAELTIGAAECSVGRIGTAIPIERIGEAVRRVTLAAPVWTEATATAPAYCRVDGVIDPVDTSPTARPIIFGVALPSA